LPVFNADRRLLELDQLEQGGRPSAGAKLGRSGGRRPRRRR
jgi:hypothetical protein